MAKPERHPSDVITAILKHVPEDRVDLRRHLEGISTDSCYCPPEGMSLMWRRLGDTLLASLPLPPVVAWEIRVGQIVRGEAAD